MDKDVCQAEPNAINISKLKPDEKFVNFTKLEKTIDGKISQTEWENNSFTRFTTDNLQIEKLSRRKMLKSLERLKASLKEKQDLELKDKIEELKCKFRTQLRPYEEGIEKIQALILLEDHGYEITKPMPSEASSEI